MIAIQAYLERLPARIAEMKLALSEAASMPHMQQDDKRDLMDTWKDLAGIHEQEAEPVSPAVLKMMGIGVVMHPPLP